MEDIILIRFALYITLHITLHIIQVDVGLIIFQHHHLFSLEHHLSTKLVDTYHAYMKIRAIQASKGLDNRINVLYRSLDELKSKKDTWTEEEMEFQVLNSCSITITLYMRKINM